jgi:hypothetical protein
VVVVMHFLKTVDHVHRCISAGFGLDIGPLSATGYWR